MATVTQLLDPSARDPQLRAFAYIQARFASGYSTAVDCLRPLVTYAIAKHNGQPLNLQQIIDYVRSHYHLTIPFYTLHDMVPQLRKTGVLKYDELSKTDLCTDILGADEDSAKEFDLSLDDIAKAGQRLAEYAEVQGLRKPTTSADWSDALVKFFQSESAPNETKPTKVGDVIISNPTHLDNFIVASFIRKIAERDQTLLRVIERVYYGVLVSDFLMDLEHGGNKADYSGLFVVYDATVLMRLLGTSGRAFRVATTELHETLGSLGCRIFYYPHTYDEVLNNVQAVRMAYENKSRMNPETREALDSGETTITTIRAIETSLDSRLGQLGITELGVSFTERQKDQYQIGETDLAHRLAKGNQARLARAERDASSVAMTLRIRERVASRDVAKCKIVFITQNSTFAWVTRNFLKENKLLEDRMVNPVLTVGQMMTVGWIANEIPFEPKRVSKELIANCYRASLPMEGWEEALWTAIEDADPEGTEEYLKDYIFVQTVRNIAQEKSFGHPQFLPKRNEVSDIIQRARQESAKRVDEARAGGWTDAEKEIRAEGDAHRVEKSRIIAKKATNLVKVGTLVAFYIALAWSLFSAVVPLTIVVGIATGVLTAIYAGELVFGWSISGKAFLPVERLVLRIIRALQRTIG